MSLWFAIALMTAAAAFAVLLPLGRRAPLRQGNDLAVYRDQLGEIERDREAGLIAPDDAGAARVEISRRLIAAADAVERDDNATRAQGSAQPWHVRAVALCALVLVPVVAIGSYALLGSPDLPGAPLAQRAMARPDASSVEALVSQVEAHLERNPQDGRGWEVLAPVYMRIGRYDDAVAARRRTIALNGESAERHADLGEALTMAANGVVTAEAKSAFDRALVLDPKHVKARYYAGITAEQDGKRDDAAALWRALLADAPADASWTGRVREALARVSPPQRGPTQDDVASAAQLDDTQRNEMVGGMVARLAERLQQDGSDLEGWLRLARSYVVLGERDKAQAALSDARRALAQDADKLRRIDEAAKGLGLS